ncbi:MAG TPA: 2-C-methyl-D-erythritol 4-phosphate cytidylyltransferase [candidate division Zixibacteria bacterium]|nr:2-C-methyl-D-erythritol 4-phosphate cytidylyltransferase [candidate division Zixibacteria bacterium]
MKTAAVIVAGGKSVRFGGEVPKQFRHVLGRPLLSWAVSRFEKAVSIDNIVVVAPEEYLLHIGDHIIDPFSFSKVTKIVVGGETRAESVLRGLKSLPISTGYVAIHDGARPLILPQDIDRVVELAHRERAAMIAVAATDTIKRVKDGYILATLDRQKIFQAQTPQVFQYDLIMEAYRRAEQEGLEKYTDDASLLEAGGFKVRVMEPSGPNFKVTTPIDLKLVEALMKEEIDG